MLEAPFEHPLVVDPAVELIGVAKAYTSFEPVLAPINLTIRRGEFVSLIGPSGCGKSTTLNIIAGLTTPSGGTVQVMGQSPARIRRRSGEIAFVFQDATLMPWRTVAANVALALELMRVPRAERQRRVANILSVVHLTDVANKLPRQLSGGMKMRVSIARALVTEPKILLLDEPFGALDEITRQHLHQELLNLWQWFHTTVVFVTHNVFEAVYLSQRIIVMGANPGRIVKEIAISEPYPRDPRFRSSTVFAHLVDNVISALGEGGTP